MPTSKVRLFQRPSQHKISLKSSKERQDQSKQKNEDIPTHDKFVEDSLSDRPFTSTPTTSLTQFDMDGGNSTMTTTAAKLLQQQQSFMSFHKQRFHDIKYLKKSIVPKSAKILFQNTKVFPDSLKNTNYGKWLTEIYQRYRQKHKITNFTKNTDIVHDSVSTRPSSVKQSTIVDEPCTFTHADTASSYYITEYIKKIHNPKNDRPKPELTSISRPTSIHSSRTAATSQNTYYYYYTQYKFSQNTEQQLKELIKQYKPQEYRFSSRDSATTTTTPTTFSSINMNNKKHKSILTDKRVKQQQHIDDNRHPFESFLIDTKSIKFSSLRIPS